MISSYRYLSKVLPLLHWSRGYDVDKAVCDLVAGITVGLTLIPQSLAYASLAGLEPQYGLYSSLCGGIIYLLFGTIPELSIAPTAILSLLTYSYTKNVSFGNVHAAILLCFFGGVIELLCGILHLGFLVDFVSTPVVSAFTSAGAITIASSQVKNLIGVRIESGESFFEIWKNIFARIAKFKLWDTVLGLSCCVVLLFMRQMKDFGLPLMTPGSKEATPIYRKVIWLLSVARNALVVVGCAVAAFLLDVHGMRPFSLTAKVPSGWPNVSLPHFRIETGNRTVTFADIAVELEAGIIFIPFIAILANVGIAKAFAHGRVIDASQEMIAVGACNIVGSFFGSYPVNASFSRAAVGGASGVRTPVAGVYTAFMVLLAFTLLTPYFSYIPKPTLAAVIICAVIFMVEVMISKNIWIVYRLDLVPFLTTFVSCLLFGIEMGIIVGIIVDLMKILYISARPNVLVERIPVDSEVQYLKYTPTSSVMFSSAEFVREKILHDNIDQGRNVSTVVLDFERIGTLDYTAALCLSNLVDDLQKNDKEVILLRLKESLQPKFETLSKHKLASFTNDVDLRNHLLGYAAEKHPETVISDIRDGESVADTKL